jgi:hypothetical protein
VGRLTSATESTPHFQQGCGGFSLALALIAKNNTSILAQPQDADVEPVIRRESAHKELGTPQKEGAQLPGTQLAAS